MVTRIVILGSTGSIGRSALDVVRHYPERFEVVGLAAGGNVELLAQQAAEFKPKYISIGDESGKDRLNALNLDAEIWTGLDGLVRLGSVPVDVTLCAVVGSVGLRPLLAAMDAGNRIALANKESLVMAGRVVTERARAKQAVLLPVDSEHNAIYQCLHGHRLEDVNCVHITASGGPFYKRTRESLWDVTPAEATHHPTWDMGAKISVDSATLMNKGLEVIEAMWLFDLPLSKIEVVIHPQSIVHSLVEFNDGSILGHLGITDMKFPILFALTWPERVKSPMGRLDLTRMRELNFAAPDFDKFPCLRYALSAASEGGTAPAMLNAANETAVNAFCNGRIRFLEIEQVVRRVMDGARTESDHELEVVEIADRSARAAAEGIIRSLETHQ